VRIDGVVGCASTGTNTTSHFIVSPRLSDGRFTTADNRKRFYVIITGDSSDYVAGPPDLAAGGPSHHEISRREIGLVWGLSVPVIRGYPNYRRVGSFVVTTTATATPPWTEQRTSTGSLVIAGSGIKAVAHLTTETIARIKAADKVVFCVADAITEGYLRELNPNAEDLHVYYGDGKQRRQTYAEMTERTMSLVRDGHNVCLVLYGHPGVFVNPSFACADACRAEDIPCEFLAAVSAEDCLFADLKIDPSRDGCQTFEATNFLLRHRVFDVNTPMVLWQVGCVGDPAFDHKGYDSRHLPVLVEFLQGHYGADHEVVVYEAATHPLGRRRIELYPLSELAPSHVTGISTLFVPPLGTPPVDRDLAQRLGLLDTTGSSDADD
jgi:hypothetical protein